MNFVSNVRANRTAKRKALVSARNRSRANHPAGKKRTVEPNVRLVVNR